MRTVHEKKKDYSCNKCEFSFTEQKHLILHKMAVHEGKQLTSDGIKEILNDLQVIAEKGSVTPDSAENNQKADEKVSCNLCKTRSDKKAPKFTQVTLQKHIDYVHGGQKTNVNQDQEKKTDNKRALILSGKTDHDNEG